MNSRLIRNNGIIWSQLGSTSYDRLGILRFALLYYLHYLELKLGLELELELKLEQELGLELILEAELKL